MLNLFSLYLESSHPQTGYVKHYSIHMGKDLFGYWLVFIYFGHSGKKGVSRNYAFQGIEEAYHWIRIILKKRLSPSNINRKPYTVKGLDIDYLKIPLPLSFISSISEELRPL